MFKNVNRYLVTNYPQLWNTRAVWAILVLVIIHAVFYTAGYLSFNSYLQLHDTYRYGTDLIGTYTLGFSVMVAVIFILIWLSFYFRNNPFKNYYPLPRFYFAAEFTIIFVFILLAITGYKSYTNGFWKHISNKMADVNLVQQVNILNMAYAFLPIEPEDYSAYSSYDTVNYIDSLESLRIERMLNTGDRALLDTLIKRFYINREESSDSVYSYLNFYKQYYCFEGPLADSVNSADSIYHIMSKWLKTSNRREVDHVLIQFDSMCNRYLIERMNVNITTYGDTVFKHPDFSIDTFPLANYHNKDATDSTISYINFSDISVTLHNIYLSRSATGSLGMWLAVIFVALLLSLAIFTFRLTNIWVWFIALVGAGVLILAVTLLFRLIHIDWYIPAALLALWGMLLAGYIILKGRGYKMPAAVTLIWFSWSLPFVGPLIIGLIITKYRYLRAFRHHHQLATIRYCIYNFVLDNYEYLLLGFIVLLFIFIVTLLWRSYRSWMAMAEE